MTTSRRARTALVAIAWAAAVVVATLVGMSAVGAIGSGIVGGGQRPLTSDQVDESLAAARAAEAAEPAAPSPAPAPTSAAPAGATDVVGSPGGTIVARCTAGAVEVVSASPAQGFRLDDEQEDSRVRFESEETDGEGAAELPGRPPGRGRWRSTIEPYPAHRPADAEGDPARLVAEGVHALLGVLARPVLIVQQERVRSAPRYLLDDQLSTQVGRYTETWSVLSEPNGRRSQPP